MHTIVLIGGILGLLAIAGGQALVVFVVRAGVIGFVAFCVWGAWAVHQPVTPGWLPGTQPSSACTRAGYSSEFCRGVPDGYVPDYSPAASPPAQPGPIHIPLQDVAPVPPLPAQTVGGWGVDDTSGPWPADEIRPASARADRLLRRLHQAQGVEMGP